MNIEGRKEKTQKEIEIEKNRLEKVIGEILGEETQIELKISRIEEKIEAEVKEIEKIKQQIVELGENLLEIGGKMLSVEALRRQRLDLKKELRGIKEKIKTEVSKKVKTGMLEEGLVLLGEKLSEIRKEIIERMQRRLKEELFGGQILKIETQMLEFKTKMREAGEEGLIRGIEELELELAELEKIEKELVELEIKLAEIGEVIPERKEIERIMIELKKEITKRKEEEWKDYEEMINAKRRCQK